MARTAQSIFRANAMRAAEVDALTDKLFRAKRRVFRRTLLETARSFGRAIERPDLSDEVTAALQADALRSARRIAETFNEQLAEFLATAEDSGDALAASAERWARGYRRRTAKMIAVTEAYSAHADATLAFFRDVGLEELPTFEFGGHPDDSDPACEICRAIVAGNPYSLDEVVAIGTPHPNCRQSWHPLNFDVRQLPTVLELGRTIGGIVGEESLVGRSGTRAKAVESVEALRE